MGDFGIKISNLGENVNTSNLEGTSFDSRYSSLMLITKQTLTFTAAKGELSPTGTVSYTHGLGYAPLTIAYVDYIAGSDQYKNGPIPYNYTVTPSGAFSGNFLFSYISMDISTTTIKIDWQTMEYLPGEEYNLSDDVDYTVTLYVYGFELGQSID